MSGWRLGEQNPIFGDTLPAASSDYRGTMFYVLSASGTIDELWVCMQDDSGTPAYQWQLIAFGSA